jgi:hypothetical protein
MKKIRTRIKYLKYNNQVSKGKSIEFINLNFFFEEIGELL